MPYSTTNTAEISQIYNARSTSYDSSSDSLHVRQTQAYLAHLAPYLRPGASVLDLACGTGLLTRPAKRLVGATGRVVGVDVSRGMLEVARAKGREIARQQGQGQGGDGGGGSGDGDGDGDGDDVEWYEHDISDLTPLNLGSFDIITCASALVLLPSPSAALRHWMSDLLKPGSGRLMTDVHVPRSNIVMDVFSSISDDDDDDEIGTTLKWDMTPFRSLASLSDLLRDAGLEIEQAWETQGFGTTEIDAADAGRIFDDAVQSPMFANFGNPQGGVRKRARAAFVKRLEALAAAGSSNDGKLREETRYWICIGRKPPTT